METKHKVIAWIVGLGIFFGGYFIVQAISDSNAASQKPKCANCEKMPRLENSRYCENCFEGYVDFLEDYYD